MKKTILVLLIAGLSACGNESSNSKPTDLDRTDNDDTIFNQNEIPDSVPKKPVDSGTIRNSDTSILKF